MKTVAAVLKVYRVRRFTVETIREALQTPAVYVAPGTVEAAHAHIALLLPRLRLLQQQGTAVARRIEALLEDLGPEAVPGEPRDVTILRSLPGVGRVVAATVLAEAAQPLAERDYRTLRAHGGIAPVTRKSGKKLSVSMRYGCNPRLRNAFYHWARTSVQNDPHCRGHCDRLRRQGHGHARALRGVADRSLGVLVAMLTSRHALRLRAAPENCHLTNGGESTGESGRAAGRGRPGAPRAHSCAGRHPTDRTRARGS
jgi:transposase